MKFANKLFVFLFIGCITMKAFAGEVVGEGVLVVKEPVQSYEQEGDYREIAVVGKLENTSSSYIENIVIESQFFNSKGELIDVYTERQYSMIAPPNETIAFSISKQAIREESEYSTNMVRITYAEIRSSFDSRKDGWIIKMLINWAPLIIIIGAWVIVMVRFQKKSPQAKTLELVEQQNELIRKNGEQFKEFLEIVREYTKRNA